MLVVAIDIGGTFTDLIGFDEKTNAFIQAKSLTTPAQLVQGIIDCLNKSGIKSDGIDELIHGSSIAINTLIERKGAKTGLVVTRGTRDPRTTTTLGQVADRTVGVHDEFFVVEPQANVTLNLTQGQRIIFGVGYRAVADAGRLRDDLNGVSGSVSFQIGGK